MKRFFTHNIEEAAKTAGVFFRSRYGIWLLGGISFIESALPVPVVTDPFLAAYILSDRTRALRGVVVTSLTSVLGGVAAYLMAAGLYEVLENTVLSGDTYADFYEITILVQDSVFWFTLVGAFTPLPYTLVGMAVGFVKANFFAFVLASIIGRTVRYSIVGYLVYRYGERALSMAQRQIWLVSIVAVLLGVAYLLH